MQSPSTIRILANNNNERGDLFNRLVGDLFFALGYDDLRFNIHKSGREVDVEGTHRKENRRMIAECKCQANPIGGDDLNKFYGVLNREQDKDAGSPLCGYYVSLNGFRETGVEQEINTSPGKRLILLSGNDIVEELQRSRIIVDPGVAIERAGRCVEISGLDNIDLEKLELLGHDEGYLWAVYYSQNKLPTHFVLVHADGTPIAPEPAREIVDADRKCEGSLHELTYLRVRTPEHSDQALLKNALEHYQKWMTAECGYIQLDGLPADADLSTRAMRLERLFVPIRILKTSEESIRHDGELVEDNVVTIGEFLDSHRRCSVLAKPGGGKSTLLKRLAVAYADSDRRLESNDSLPDRDWLPLFLRCRELRDRAHRPIRELLSDIAVSSGMDTEQTRVFEDFVDQSLRSGSAMLLIDGLDEITSEGSRLIFANHLRTFLAVFPKIATVASSREAGYRHIAGVIASACSEVLIAPFNQNDVAQLCESWHLEVVGDSDKVRNEAQKLAQTIWENERIRVLAENPLMLTTLLVVRRNVGELPTRRVKLYEAAINVLMRTWNVEGFEPLDEDETLAQLSFVAYAMMEAGQQQIGKTGLVQLLRQARNELETELQFTALSPVQFIERIEYRSSLLMQTGHGQFGEQLQELFEFRHLTFQEFLAARALVEEQYPGRDGGKRIVELLEPHFEDESWREVIPLAAVLSGRKAEPVIQRLSEICRKNERIDRLEIVMPAVLLQQCLLDEVQVSPSVLREALSEIARFHEETDAFHYQLRNSKFGDMYLSIVEDAYFGADPRWTSYLSAMAYAALDSLRTVEQQDFAETVLRHLRSEDLRVRARAALVCMTMAFSRFKSEVREPSSLEGTLDAHMLDSVGECEVRSALEDLLTDTNITVRLASIWALAWLGTTKVPQSTPTRDAVMSLYNLWRTAENQEFRRFARWAFSSQPLLNRDTFLPCEWSDASSIIEHEEGDFSELACCVLAWYLRKPWTDSEIVARLMELKGPDKLNSRDLVGRRLLARLGGAELNKQGDADE